MTNTKNMNVCYLAEPKDYKIKTQIPPVNGLTVALTDEEINRIGKEKYEREYAHKVDIEDNKGKYFVLDVVTGFSQIGEDLLLLTEQAQQQNPHSRFYLKRIGYDYIAKFI